MRHCDTPPLKVISSSVAPPLFLYTKLGDPLNQSRWCSNRRLEVQQRFSKFATEEVRTLRVIACFDTGREVAKFSWATGKKYLPNWRKNYGQRRKKTSAMFGETTGNVFRSVRQRKIRRRAMFFENTNN